MVCVRRLSPEIVYNMDAQSYIGHLSSMSLHLLAEDRNPKQTNHLGSPGAESAICSVWFPGVCPDWPLHPEQYRMNLGGLEGLMSCYV